MTHLPVSGTPDGRGKECQLAVAQNTTASTQAPAKLPDARRRGSAAQMRRGRVPDLGELSQRVERPLRVAILAPPWFPVPPTGYGGTETVVSLLTDGLVEAGHDVTLFASGDSQTTAKLASVFPKAPSERIGQTLVELQHILSCYERADEFDLISDHAGPPGAALAGAVRTPAVHTVHLAVDGEIGSTYEQIARVVPGLGLISLSRSQRRARPDLPWIGNCPNAIDLDAHSLCTERGDYLAFVGRMNPDKGPDRAIKVARAVRLPLKIAAKMRQPDEVEYFETHVRPKLGEGVEYLGELEQRDKVELLQHARATLFPIEWEEPFGLVMIESMACGTPVIATRRGSVPEVIEHGRSGIIVNDTREMAHALSAAARLDPLECRRSVEERFSPERMVQNYLDVYKLVLATQPAKPIGARTSTRPGWAQRTGNTSVYNATTAGGATSPPSAEMSHD